MLVIIAAIVWGGFAAQFIIQLIVSLISALINLAGLVFSPVSPMVTGAGALAGILQVIFFALMFAVGSWLFSKYIGFIWWNGTTITLAVAFAFSLVYCAVQMPSKLVLAWAVAWQSGFAETSMIVPRGQQREEFAWKQLLEWRRTKRTRSG